MATSGGTIRGWLKRGKAQGATHLIVVCDTFEHDDYPVYVQPEQDVHEIANKFDGKNMQTLMEVYNLSKDWEDQLNQPRSFNY